MNAALRIGRRHGEDGFVLVGVLMFILILTILGLTLFSLSSFESQFFTNSLDQQRAFYSATGGIERAKYVLSSTSRLADARDIAGVPLEGLTYTVAKQGTDFASADSSDTLKWTNNPKPVWIRALAVVGGQRAMVEAQFTPHRGPNYYERLFTLSNASPDSGLVVRTLGGEIGNQWLAAGQVFLAGELWQNSRRTDAWTGVAQAPAPIDMTGGVPVPDLTSYFARFWTPTTPIVVPDPELDVYYLDAYNQIDHVGFWKTPFSLSADYKKNAWSLNGEPAALPYSDGEIHVRGTCIWMFDHGVRFNRHMFVYGSGNADDALVLVARPTFLDPLEFGRGIVFNQPLWSATVPVYLVSDGGVGIEAQNSSDFNSSITYLSVFARLCSMIGPRPGHSMTLMHLPGSPQDAPSTGLIDRLSKKGYLPNTSGVGGDFIPIAGKWREITDSDPVN